MGSASEGLEDLSDCTGLVDRADTSAGLSGGGVVAADSDSDRVDLAARERLLGWQCFVVLGLLMVCGGVRQQTGSPGKCEEFRNPIMPSGFESHHDHERLRDTFLSSPMPDREDDPPRLRDQRGPTSVAATLFQRAHIRGVSGGRISTSLPTLPGLLQASSRFGC